MGARATMGRSGEGNENRRRDGKEKEEAPFYGSAAVDAAYVLTNVSCAQRVLLLHGGRKRKPIFLRTGWKSRQGVCEQDGIATFPLLLTQTNRGRGDPAPAGESAIPISDEFVLLKLRLNQTRKPYLSQSCDQV